MSLEATCGRSSPERDLPYSGTSAFSISGCIAYLPPAVRNGIEPRQPIIKSDDGAKPLQASACGWGDGVPVKVSGFSGQPPCDLRCDIDLRTSGLLYAPRIITLP